MADERDPVDFYQSPEIAVDMLLEHTPLTGPILEPSAGLGALVRPLRRHGFTVTAYDLTDHGIISGEGIKTGVDFLAQDDASGCVSVVLNPPYKDADKHVRHALKIAPQGGVVCVLLRLTWMAAKKRADLLPHIEKIIICGRLKMLPPNVVDKGHGGTVEFAWFIFRLFRLPLGTVIVRAG